MSIVSQRYADREISSPHQSMDFDQFTSTTLCSLGSAVSPFPQMTLPEICVMKFIGDVPSTRYSVLDKQR